MHRFVAIAALLACSAASPSPEPRAEGLTEHEIPRLQPRPREAVCRDRIHLVRKERGLPEVERENANPEEPYFIAAVDHRIDGCSVMVMRNDTSDVRPIPKPNERSPLLRPAQ